MISSRLEQEITGFDEIVRPGEADFEKSGLKEGPKTFERIGGAEGDRALGLMTASHALSQLSYSPTLGLVYHRDRNCQ